MPAKKTSKQAGPLVEQEIHAEWFPVYGIRVEEWPHIKYITGGSEAEAITNFAASMAHEGKRQNKKFRATFTNEAFEID